MEEIAKEYRKFKRETIQRQIDERLEFDKLLAKSLFRRGDIMPLYNPPKIDTSFEAFLMQYGTKEEN